MDLATLIQIAKDLGAWALSAVAAGAVAWFLLKAILASLAARIEALERTITEERLRSRMLEDRQFNEVAQIARDAHVIAKEYALFIRSPPKVCPYADDTPEPTNARREISPDDTTTILAAARTRHSPHR